MEILYLYDTRRGTAVWYYKKWWGFMMWNVINNRKMRKGCTNTETDTLG